MEARFSAPVQTGLVAHPASYTMGTGSLPWVKRPDSSVPRPFYPGETSPNPRYPLAGIAQSVYRLATGWTVRGSNAGGGEIFRSRPDRPWSPPSLLHNGYLVFPADERPGRDVGHPPYLAPRLKKEDSYTSTPTLWLRGLF